MENKMGINLYDYSIEDDKNSLSDIFYSLLKVGNLTPIIGNGFTSTMRTKQGSIPLVTDLMDEMINILCGITKCSKDEYEGSSLTDLADLFWEEIEKKENKKYFSQFQEYIETNFTKSFDLEQPRRTFLNSNWSMIYTMNYDDTIENTLDINLFIPYDSVNLSSKKKYLIKLHGDAKKFYLTGNKDFCILGNRQYANLIKDENNRDILRTLEDTFFSHDILFVGCGLENELDVLYSADTKLNDKLKIDNNHKIIYVLYGENKQEFKLIKYKKYGITDIVIVDKKSIVDFYEMIHEKSLQCQNLHDEDVLKDFTDIKFEHLDDRNPDNKEYLFFGDKVSISNGIIKLPSFFIERTLGNQIIQKINKDSHVVHIISGTNLSGKTYVLIHLMKFFSYKKVYYFPSNKHLEDNLLSDLLMNKDILILIDEDVISFEQYKNIILSSLDTIKSNGIKIVLNINKSDSDFYKNYSYSKDCYGDKVKLFPLENKLDTDEIKNFNDKVGKLSLVDYYENNTILDYLYRAEAGILKKYDSKILPKVHFLSGDNDQKIRALIALTTKNALTSEEAIELRIDESLYELAREFPKTIQRDYMSTFEKRENIHSGFKFVLNSSYWAMQALSNLASNSHNYNIIANSYHKIIDSYVHLPIKLFNNKTKPYYMLDKIQLIFYDKNKKGMLRLPYFIYEELHSSLSDNYHFLHQEAKCELRVARRENDINKKQTILEKAYENLERALSLTEKVHSDTIEYTNTHILVTKALILTNYIFSGMVETLNEAIGVYYDVFVKYKDLTPQLKEDEIQDFNTFFSSVWNGKYELDDANRKIFNEFYTNYTNINKEL